MSRIRLYISAGIFIVLTVIKLAAPSVALEVRQKLIPLSEQALDYRQALTTLGGLISGGPDEYVVTDAGDLWQAPDDFQPRVLAEVHRQFRGDYIIPPQADLSGDEASVEQGGEQDEQSPEPAAEESENAEQTQNTLIQAFLESQSEFSDLAVPVNVSYDMPQLPFVYTAPVAGATSSGFGYRSHPIEGGVKFHYGTDIAAYTGTDIYAFASGTVVVAAESESYGKYLIITHDGGYSTLYAHCSELLASPGDMVYVGQKVALVGETGMATGPHLHFELMNVSVYLNPEYYINYKL